MICSQMTSWDQQVRHHSAPANNSFVYSFTKLDKFTAACGCLKWKLLNTLNHSCEDQTLTIPTFASSLPVLRAGAHKGKDPTRPSSLCSLKGVKGKYCCYFKQEWPGCDHGCGWKSPDLTALCLESQLKTRSPVTMEVILQMKPSKDDEWRSHQSCVCRSPSSSWASRCFFSLRPLLLMVCL